MWEIRKNKLSVYLDLVFSLMIVTFTMSLCSGNDINIHQAGQPESFVSLMGEHFADPSVSKWLKLQE